MIDDDEKYVDLFFGGGKEGSSERSKFFLSSLEQANLVHVFSSCEAVGGRLFLGLFGGDFSYNRIGGAFLGGGFFLQFVLYTIIIFE